MKRILIICCCLSILFFSTLIGAAEIFKIDPEHSYVLYEIKHFGFSTQTGKWPVSGTLTLDKDHPDQSKVDVIIQVGDVNSGVNNLDKHLKGKLFFDVEHFPTASFKSDKVEVTGKETAKVQGILTIRGISKRVNLSVVQNKTGLSPITDKMTVGFSANTTLKRSDFGINTLLPGLGNEVKLKIEAEAYQEKPMAS